MSGLLTKKSSIKVKDEQGLANLTGGGGMSGLLPVIKLQDPVLKLTR